MDRVNHAGGDVSALLQAWGQGDVEARDRVMEVVYQELRRRAAAYLRRERAGHTLQPTALVHEAYLRLVDQNAAAWRNRATRTASLATLTRALADCSCCAATFSAACSSATVRCMAPIS